MVSGQRDLLTQACWKGTLATTFGSVSRRESLACGRQISSTSAIRLRVQTWIQVRPWYVFWSRLSLHVPFLCSSLPLSSSLFSMHAHTTVGAKCFRYAEELLFTVNYVLSDGKIITVGAKRFRRRFGARRFITVVTVAAKWHPDVNIVTVGTKRLRCGFCCGEAHHSETSSVLAANASVAREHCSSQVSLVPVLADSTTRLSRAT